MSQYQATDCINQIEIAQTKIAKYNTDWNIWDIEYKRLSQEIINKETEIDSKDLNLFQWVMSQLQNNPRDALIKGPYDRYHGCGNWPGNECSETCRNIFINNGMYTTPRGRRPLSIAHHHTHMQHCSWTLPSSATYRCYCKIMTEDSKSYFDNNVSLINQLIVEKTTLQNTINQHGKDMPQFPPLVVRCCDKTIECDNKIYGPNSCFGNLQICRQSNFNILDKSRTTELENSNKTKILKIKDELNPISNQVRELLNSIFILSRQLSVSFDSNSITNSISNIKKIYDQISLLITKIETIKNINNVENEAKVLFDYITSDTTHKREMQSIYETISVDVKNLKNIILQAKNTFLNIKTIYENLLNEDLNINLLKVEKNQISKSISSLNNNLDNLEILYNTANSLTISTKDDIDKILEIYNKSVVLVKNINLETKELNEFKNSLTTIFNKFTINSFFYNDVKIIYDESLNYINNIIKRINEIKINNIIENIYNLYLIKKKNYESDLVRLDEEKLKIIQDEELKKIQEEINKNLNNIKLTNNLNIIDNKNIDNEKIINYNNDIKQEDTSSINIIYIVIGIAFFIIIILFLFIIK
jgi:hypothetical protein